MAPLPVRPAFPVYGLPASFTGFRWLLIWQRRGGPHGGDVTEVSLAHGHPSDGPFNVVTTVLKHAGRNLSGGSAVGEVGLEYAAVNAIMHAIESGPATGAELAELDRREADRIRERAGGEVVLEGWRLDQMLIDGSAQEAGTRELGHSRASVVDLDLIVMASSGPTGLIAEPRTLSDVSGCLGDYVAGRGETADKFLT